MSAAGAISEIRRWSSSPASCCTVREIEFSERFSYSTTRARGQSDRPWGSRSRSSSWASSRYKGDSLRRASNAFSNELSEMMVWSRAPNQQVWVKTLRGAPRWPVCGGTGK